MNRTEALLRLREREVPVIRNQILLRLELTFQEKKETLADAFGKHFQAACMELIERQAKEGLLPISFLIITVLRTRIAEGDYRFPIIACGDNWWLDPVQVSVGCYQADFVFDFYQEMREELMGKSRQYVMKLFPQDIDCIMQEELEYFQQYVGRIAKYKILSLTQTKEFQSILKGGCFQIHVSEYMDQLELIYQECKEQDVEALVGKLKEKKRELLCFADIKGMTLPSTDFTESDLRFADLKGSNFKHATFRHSLLIGTIFTECDLEGVDFSYSYLNEAIFKGANLRGAVFHQVEAYEGLEYEGVWDTAGYYPVDFTDANLEGADFTGANLRGAIFIGANLQGAKFTTVQLCGFNLSKRQRAELLEMEYFWLKTDRSLEHKINFEPLSNEELSGKVPVVRQIQRLEGMRETIFPDYLTTKTIRGQYHVVSERLKDLCSIYLSAGTDFMPFVLNDQFHESHLYWFLSLSPEEGLISKQTTFHFDQTIHKLVLYNERLPNKSIFSVETSLQRVIICKLDLAESILRRGFFGMKLCQIGLEG